MLHESSRSFDRSQSPPFRQDEFLELRTEVRGPSIGRVNDCSGSHFSTIGTHSDPAIAMFLRDAQDRRVCLKVQVAFLEQLLQQCVDEFVRPSVEQTKSARISSIQEVSPVTEN